MGDVFDMLDSKQDGSSVETKTESDIPCPVGYGTKCEPLVDTEEEPVLELPLELPVCNYLVDLENTGNAWSIIIPRLSLEDRVFFFWTVNSTRMDTANMAALTDTGCQIRFHKCEIGRSGLDFQLCSELGNLAAKEPLEKFFVVSDDKEFDVLIPYWAGRGVTIERIQTDNNRSKDVPAVNAAFRHAVARKGMTMEEQRRQLLQEWKDRLDAVLPSGKQGKAARGHFMGVMKAVSSMNGKKARMRRIHMNTINRFGEAEGNMLYRMAHPVVSEIMAQENPFPFDC